MRSVSGKYRMDAASAEFFGSRTICLIGRGSEILGRFGRTGTIRGSLAGYVADAVWHDFHREGWMTLTFDAGFTSCYCRYGIDRKTVLGRFTLSRILRKRAAAS